MASNLPTIAQLQDPAWVKSQSQRVQSQIFRATEGKHRAKNDVVKLNSNYVQRRAADKRWREAHPDAYLQQQPAFVQPPPTTGTTTNPTPGQSTGGGQGQNVRFNQKIDKMDRRAQGQTQTSTATSDRRDATADARDAGAPAPRPSTSVIGTTSSMGAAPTRNPFQTPTAPIWATTPAAPVFTPQTNRNNGQQRQQGNGSSLPAAPAWVLPAAPRVPSGIPYNEIPSGIPTRTIPAGIPAQPSYPPARPQPATVPSVPSGVLPGGQFGPTNGAYNVYFDPNGKRYMVTADGRFIPSVVNQRTLAGQPNAYGEAYDQAALARLAYARAMSNYLQPLPAGQQQSGGGFGSYYGGGFGGGGGGGGYTSYDPYNGNPAWYNNTDLTAWNIQ